jgi:hypothetical protein
VNTGVVDQDVEAPEGVDGGGNSRLPIRFRDNVEVPIACPGPGFAQQGGDLLTAFVVEIGDHYRSALAGYPFGRGFPDAAGRAGDQRGPAC